MNRSTFRFMGSKTVSRKGSKCHSLKLARLQSKLGYLVLFLCLISSTSITTTFAQSSLAENSSVENSTVSINIRPDTENEYFIAEYQQGDTPQLGIGVSSDSYVYVFSIDSDLRYAQILPNSFESNNYVYAVQGASFPSYQGNYSFSLQNLQGYTTLFALASPRAISEARLEHYVKKYVLFAEAYSDPTKLSNVVIGPDIGIDISYLHVSGNATSQEMHSAENTAKNTAKNTVLVDPSYYQLDYALDTVMTSAIISDSNAGLDTGSGALANTINPTSYDLTNYGEEYSTGAYATAEYQEVLKTYEASMAIYNTYQGEASQVAVAPVQKITAPITNAVPVTGYRQTITLTGKEPTATNTGVNVSSIEPVETVQSITIAPTQSATLTNSIVLTSPIAASTTKPLSVVEQSLQSTVNTSPFKSWAALNLEDYRFVFQQYCYCSDDYLYQMIVTVNDSEVSRVQYLENNEDVPEYVFDSIPSIEDIFMGIAEIRVEGLTTVNVVYDQDFSFPNSTYFVNNPETDIDDLSYQISSFEIQ